jgi:hypothetical protein
MLGFLMPAEVRRYFMLPLLDDVMRAERLLQSLSLILQQNDNRCSFLYSIPIRAVKWEGISVGLPHTPFYNSFRNTIAKRLLAAESYPSPFL